MFPRVTPIAQLTLFGTAKPKDYPPVNGRITKALRYVGVNVRGGMN
jgi:hypothetical protein